MVVNRRGERRETGELHTFESEVRDSNFVALGGPFLEDGCGAALGEYAPEYCALQIVIGVSSILKPDVSVCV